MVQPYITKEEVRQYLDKIPSTGAAGTAADALLDDICVRVTDMVATELSFEFDGYESATTRIIYGDNLPYLPLPYHEADSVTAVAWGADSVLDASTWTETVQGGLWMVSGQYSNPYTAPFYGAWARAGYTVTANWGYGDPPDAVKEVCLELAVNIYRSRDKGLYTDVIGVEGGGAIRYIGGFTNQQRSILLAVKRKYLSRGMVFA